MMNHILTCEDLYLSLTDLTVVAHWVPLSNLTLKSCLDNWSTGWSLFTKCAGFRVQPSYLNSILFSPFFFFLLFSEHCNHLSFRFVVLCC